LGNRKGLSLRTEIGFALAVVCVAQRATARDCPYERKSALHEAIWGKKRPNPPQKQNGFFMLYLHHPICRPTDATAAACYCPIFAVLAVVCVPQTTMLEVVFIAK
jgi:hypothetical protein